MILGLGMKMELGGGMVNIFGCALLLFMKALSLIREAEHLKNITDLSKTICIFQIAIEFRIYGCITSHFGVETHFW